LTAKQAILMFEPTGSQAADLYLHLWHYDSGEVFTGPDYLRGEYDSSVSDQYETPNGCVL
jgi:hypothetical protein